MRSFFSWPRRWHADVIHTLHGGASLVVSESARSLSSAFVHQALLHDLYIQTVRPETIIGCRLLRGLTHPHSGATRLVRDKKQQLDSSCKLPKCKRRGRR